MSTTIPRRPSVFALSDEQRAKAREYLRSAGYDIDRMPPLIWPDDAVAAHQDHPYAPWTFTTRADVRRRKIEKMERSLHHKRDSDCVQKRALYVWVFWCPGLGGFAYRGWWTYFKGTERPWGCPGDTYMHGGGYKGNVGDHLMARVMALFPMENPHPLYPLEPREWMPLFAKQYQRGKWCGKPQGKAPIWAEVRGHGVERIIGQAEWPKLKEKKAWVG